MANSKLLKLVGLLEKIGNISSIIVVIFSIVFVLGGGYIKLNYLWEADLPRKIDAMGKDVKNMQDSMADLEETTRKNTEILNGLSDKVNDLWEYRKTRTMLLEKTVLDFSIRYSENPLDFMYTNSFLLKMKSDDIKEILDSSASHEEKIFTIIEKVGGVEKLAKLLEREDLLKSFGIFVSFVEQYN